MDDVVKKINEKLEKLKSERDSLDVKISALTVTKALMSQNHAVPAAVKAKRQIDRQGIKKTEDFVKSFSKKLVTASMVAKYFKIKKGAAANRLRQLEKAGTVVKIKRGAFRKVTK